MNNHNFVSANFCIPTRLSSEDYYQLFKELNSLGWCYNRFELGSISGYLFDDDTTIDAEEKLRANNFSPLRVREIANILSRSGYASVSLQCSLNDRIYSARIRQITKPINAFSRLIFDIEEEFFLEGKMELVDWRNRNIEKYEKVVSSIIKYMKPSFGMLDYEADLECSGVGDISSLVSWGVYLSSDTISNWTSYGIADFASTVDRCIDVEGMGILIFVYPLRINQAWTDKHENLQTLLSNKA